MAISLRSAGLTPHPAGDRPRTLIGRHRASWWLAVAGGVLGLIVVLCLAAVAYGVIRTAEIRNDLVDRLYPAETENLRLTAALIDEETGIRGYAATGQQAFLAPYAAGRGEEARALARLGVLAGETPGDETLPRDLAIVRARAEDWRTRYAEPVVAEVRGNPGEPTVETRAGDGKVLFDALRGALARQEAGILAARAQGRERLADAGRNLVIALIVVGAALVLAAIGFALMLRRAISDPLAQLIGDVRLEQFAYVASHDLQEPLRKVASFCQLLQRRYEGQLDERADQYIEFAVDGAKRMQALISDLLAFSRVGRTEFTPVPVDLDDVLTQALDNLTQRVQEQGATIETEPLPTVMGERTLLAAVFQNLVGNAVKFSGDAPPVVRIDARREGKEWVVSCRDEGIGIEPQYAERVFAIFQRLHPKETYEGTGIGLALTRKIVEHHGGRIWLDTEVRRGTTFRFTLPVVEEVVR